MKTRDTVKVKKGRAIKNQGKKLTWKCDKRGGTKYQGSGT
jgi:hypothetical protein